MRIRRIRLRDFRRYRDLQVDLAPGLTIVRGPNEAGKSTIARAIELGLSGSVAPPDADLDALRSWDAGPAAQATVTVDFVDEPREGPVRNGTVEKRFGRDGSATLTIDGSVTRDPAQVDTALDAMTGLPTAAFFRATALVGHHELDGLTGGESTLRDRLAATISAADRDTADAVRELRRILADLNPRSDRDPGRLRTAEEAVARSEAVVETGEAALAQLLADRAAANAARAAFAAATDDLTAREAMLATARRAAALEAARAAAQEKADRHAEGVRTEEELDRLRKAHPSVEPLPVLRQNVERIRGLAAKVEQLRSELAEPVHVSFSVAAVSRSGVGLLAAAIVLVVVGAVGLVSAAVTEVARGSQAGNLGTMPADTIGLFVAGVVACLAGLGLARAGLRRRRAARALANEPHMGGAQVDRRLRGRTLLEVELKESEAEFEDRLGKIGATDLASAEDLQHREEEHVASIDRLTGKLEGLVGRVPVETLPALRDAAVAEVAAHAAALESIVPEAREAGAIERLEGDIGAARERVDLARDAAATADARVAANKVDAAQVTGEVERLTAWREELDELQRRARVHAAALEGIERATVATMQRATRYLELRMAEGIERITDRRYRRVRIDDESLRVELFAPEKGGWVDVSELSEGLRAQVYLAARLAMVRHVTEDRRPPIVLDDPFVSFDDVRAARAFGALRDLTRDHQVIFLTTSDRYDSGADAIVELPGPTAVDMDGGEVG